MNGYSKDTFVEADEKTYRGMTWDILEHIHTAVTTQPESCSKKFIPQKYLWRIVAAGLGFGVGAGWIAIEQVLKLVG